MAVKHIKKNLLILFFGILIASCSSSKTEKKKIRYFNEKNVEISEPEFTRIRSTRKFLSIAGDSINHTKLIVRENHGDITNNKDLRDLLENTTNLERNPNKPIVIIYYPGKDACNSSGFTYKGKKMWYGELEIGLDQIAQVKPIYIYKDNTGLKKNDETLIWHKDPEGIIERLFFKHHYPCNSFVVISKTGNFISYFGEFTKEYVWEATQRMNK